MKNTAAIASHMYTCSKYTAHRYPNAADRRKLFEQLVDRLLAAAIAVAVGVIILFLFTL